MIHPDTCLRTISALIGNGVFATAFIPKGTIVYAKDSLEIEIDPGRYLTLDRHSRPIVDKYSYIDPDGMRIVSWDLAKYVNHSCDFNSLSTGYGFEIAVRDIQPGEEITDDYGLLNLEESFVCGCNSRMCRGTVGPNDRTLQGPRWDSIARDCLHHLQSVPQPLWPVIDPGTRRAVSRYLRTGTAYRPIHRLLCALQSAEHMSTATPANSPPNSATKTSAPGPWTETTSWNCR